MTRIALVVFLSNAVLLVLQLVAGRLLAPFVGVSLATWTCVIGVFLAGISLGNWFGGQLADRGASERTVRRLLLIGAATVLFALGVVWLLGDGHVLRAIPLYPRILLLTLTTCLPPAFVLSLITPVAIKLLLPDVAHTGRVAGLVYALGTAGSLAGNFLTGFVLLAQLTTYVIVLGAVGLLGVLSLIVRDGDKVSPHPPAPSPKAGEGESFLGSSPLSPKTQNVERNLENSPPSPALGEGGWGGEGKRNPPLPLPTACSIVFGASFCSMALEIAASRLLAPHLGVSLYSWTGIIGVVLAGVTIGNWVGGWIADRSPKAETLGSCLFTAGLFSLMTLVLLAVLSHEWNQTALDFYVRWPAQAVNFVNERGLVGKIVAWTTILFLIPMCLLGTISPQVTRLAVSDWEYAGRVAGRVYAWSCAGAIAGTFAAGWGGIPLLGGVSGLILAIALALVVLASFVGSIWKRPGELFLGMIVVGAAVAGLSMRGHLSGGGSRGMKYALDTNYYSIRVYDKEAFDEEKNAWGDYVDARGRVTRSLALDMLNHSFVKGWIEKENGREVRFTADDDELGYDHEKVQAEFARLAAERAGGAPHLLVIGGGGYTLPRWAAKTIPKGTVEVVEIDPGVTEMAHRRLGLARDTRIVTHNMDGRQFVQERAAPGTYQLVVQDAVNDLSVPYHIMTKEYNDAVKRLLTPDGVYLLTVIDVFEDGRLMRAAVRTLRETFRHVEVLAAYPMWTGNEQAVYVIYAAELPFDREMLAAALTKQKAGAPATVAMPAAELQAYLARKPAPVLTDAFAPVENLVSVMFRKRGEDDRERLRGR